MQALRYEKVGWDIAGEVKGLRYGENPGQEAALYKLVNGNFILGEVETILPGRYLASDVELLQSGKHPGKTNITDTDNALNILRYFANVPAVSIMKHNNPCGVAIATGNDSLTDVYQKANLADRVAAFGGTIALNRTVDKATAEAIAQNYAEVVVAPEFEEGVMDIFAAKKNLRVMKIGDMARLQEYVGVPVLDFKSLMDGGIVVQTSYVPKATTLDDIKALPI
jgi:phosphoribosylaminoimidazolecarboxamide formyltransferase/IMP cyclohydrolase